MHQHHQAHHGEPQGNEEAQPRQQRAHPDPPRDRSAAQCLVNPADGVRIAHRGPIGKVLLRFIQLVARLVEVERGGHQSDEKARHTAAERHRGDADKEEDEEHFPTTETAIRPGGVGKQSVGKKHDQDRRDCGDRGYALRDVDPESHDLRLPDPEPGYDRQEESREEGRGLRAATSGAIGLTRLLPFVHWVCSPYAGAWPSARHPFHFQSKVKVLLPTNSPWPSRFLVGKRFSFRRAFRCFSPLRGESPLPHPLHAQLHARSQPLWHA